MVMAVISILVIFTASAEAEVILKTKDGDVLSWKNYSDEGIYYCTRKNGVGISCVPKTEILSVNVEGLVTGDTNHEGMSNRSAHKEKLFTDKEANETGCSRKIDYLDDKGKTTKREYFATDKFANEKGYYRTIDYLDSNGKKTKKAFFSTDKYADENGNMLSIIYYDSDGNHTKTEFYYTDKYANKKGHNKTIDYFDSDASAMTKTELYMNDRLIKTSFK
jgi:hypothetical protein